MGLKITKKPTQLVGEVSEVVEQAVLPEVVDEYLALELKISKHNAKIAAELKRFESLKKQVVATVDETAAADEAVTLRGTGSKELEISARSNTTEITDLEQAKKFLGSDTFWKIAKVGIADLKAYLTKPQYEQVTKTEQVGSRRVKIVG